MKPTEAQKEAAIDGYVEAAFKKEIAQLRAELRMHRQKAEGEYWCWQGDGHDHLESLTCPVLIHPEDLRKLLAEARKEQ